MKTTDEILDHQKIVRYRSLFKKAMIAYAKEVIEAAAEEAKVIHDNDHGHRYDYRIDKDSILKIKEKLQ